MASELYSTIAVLCINLLLTGLVSGTSYVPSPSPPVKLLPPVKPPPSCSSCQPSYLSCPRDALKLLKLGKPPSEPCCSLVSGLVDLEAAVCLCTAIKANILGINLNIPVDLSLLLNFCGYSVPPGFKRACFRPN
ncbi:unnamed protein product [Spirodela intermedia]|uniref:Bifunctional inhibitor/plant lipid transfer protein/seed storage helical domain-containing protein n=1 Tax=Spirodela intermedia TaxID=51605 RepID=A0ABN7E8X8_SPIIN|nr:unnamed protein product [Spirodela intermedia]CAA6674330.1 unnamed protein product [Spirodela intermedia]